MAVLGRVATVHMHIPQHPPEGTYRRVVLHVDTTWKLRKYYVDTTTRRVCPCICIINTYTLKYKLQYTQIEAPWKYHGRGAKKPINFGDSVQTP